MVPRDFAGIPRWWTQAPYFHLEAYGQGSCSVTWAKGSGEVQEVPSRCKTSCTVLQGDPSRCGIASAKKQVCSFGQCCEGRWCFVFVDVGRRCRHLGWISPLVQGGTLEAFDEGLALRKHRRLLFVRSSSFLVEFGIQGSILLQEAGAWNRTWFQSSSSGQGCFHFAFCQWEGHFELATQKLVRLAGVWLNLFVKGFAFLPAAPRADWRTGCAKQCLATTKNIQC